MIRTGRLILVVALLAAVAPPASAATVSLWQSTRYVTSDEISAGAPTGGLVSDFYITADSDLLSFGDVSIDAALYQHALGSDSAAPHSALVSLDPALAADSFITMPGNTVMLGGGFGIGGDRLWGDLSNDGPVSNFHFARLTSPQAGSFSGKVALRGHSDVVYVPFNLSLPGSGDDLAIFNNRPAYTFNYSLDPPAPPATIPPIIPPVAAPIPPLLPPQNGPATIPAIIPPVAAPIPPLLPPQSGPSTPAPASPSGLGSISLSRRTRQVTADEAAGGVPATGLVHEFFVTSTSDILSINQIAITSPLYQHALGSDVEAPGAELAAMYAGLSADSFLTTPGSTLSLGGGFAATDNNNLWGDLTDDGGQEAFRFGQLTVAESGTFNGAITVSGPTGPIDLPFSFMLPGTVSELPSLANETQFSLQFSLDAPPAPAVPERQPPVALPTLPPASPEPPLLPPQLPPPTSNELPPLAQDPPASAADPAPEVAPPAEHLIDNVDVIVGEITPPEYELVIGGWIPPSAITDVWTYWNYESQLGDAASIDLALGRYLVIDADADGATLSPLVTHSLIGNAADTTLDVGLITNATTVDLTASRVSFAEMFLAKTLRPLNLGDSPLTLSSLGAAAEAPLPEPSTTGLAISVLIGALATARRSR